MGVVAAFAASLSRFTTSAMRVEPSDSRRSCCACSSCKCDRRICRCTVSSADFSAVRISATGDGYKRTEVWADNEQ